MHRKLKILKITDFNYITRLLSSYRKLNYNVQYYIKTYNNYFNIILILKNLK